MVELVLRGGIDAQMLRGEGMMANIQISGLFTVEVRKGVAGLQSRDTGLPTRGSKEIFLEVAFNGLDG